MADGDYAYLGGVSEHPSREGDTSRLHPLFAAKLSAAIQDARNQGLNVDLASGYRAPGQTGSKYDAGGNSSHTYGMASDIGGLDGPNGPKTLAWAKIAEAHGLFNPYGVGNKAESNHWQMTPYPLETHPQQLAALKAAYNNGTGDIHDVWNAGAATNATMTASAAAKPSGGDFFGALAKAESNDLPVYSKVDKDYPGQPNSRSQGFFQIDTPTWQQFAAKAGVDISKYPNAMSAPRDVQQQVVATIPLLRFGQRTQDILSKQFGTLDTSKTVGELASGAAPATATASAAPAATTAPATSGAQDFATAAKSGDIGGMLASVTKGSDQDQGQNQQKSGGVASAMEAQQKAQERASSSTPMLPQPERPPDMSGPAQQLLSSITQQQAQPLTWSSSPYGSGMAGQQTQPQPVPGVTLNSPSRVLSPYSLNPMYS